MWKQTTNSKFYLFLMLFIFLESVNLNEYHHMFSTSSANVRATEGEGEKDSSKYVLNFINTHKMSEKKTRWKLFNVPWFCTSSNNAFRLVNFFSKYTHWVPLRLTLLLLCFAIKWGALSSSRHWSNLQNFTSLNNQEEERVSASMKCSDCESGSKIYYW